MKKPKGHIAGAQRYSARLADSTQKIQVLYLGAQSNEAPAEDLINFQALAKSLLSTTDGPNHCDYAQYVDPQGVPTFFATAYWTDPAQYQAWASCEQVTSWWTDTAHLNGPLGYFWEAFCVSKDHCETIAFTRPIRGLSACPMHTIHPVDESGYWGAARDRIPASAFDTLKGEKTLPIAYATGEDTRGQLINLKLPKNTCIIRSGVSWADCGPEQHDSYKANIKPKLDLGMDYLRDNPEESGCLNLRQVDVVDDQGNSAPEGFSMGHFQSLAHLEKWAHEHPTHLAIYTRALAERTKYQDDLELRTYHEVFILDQETDFRYLNCHGKTGLLPVDFG
ncbi:phenylacetaldoxime dehydratase family protein [Tateyamaria sp.]|uniref:phenylacetaldoxime dehydratase family protein n=1 Tax=Tateyamaria sp. TaxID=1929288 RepID=UPI00329A9B05